jgi:hypothetical protein
LGGRIGRVGSLLLEGSAQRAGKAGEISAAHQLGRLARRVLVCAAGGPGSIEGGAPCAPEVPPMPPLPRRISLGRGRARLAGFGTRLGYHRLAAPAINIPAQWAGQSERGTKVKAGLTGRGEGLRRSEAAHWAAGRGVPCLVRRMAGKSAMRRNGNASAGVAHVN